MCCPDLGGQAGIHSFAVRAPKRLGFFAGMVPSWVSGKHVQFDDSYSRKEQNVVNPARLGGVWSLGEGHPDPTP